MNGIPASHAACMYVQCNNRCNNAAMVSETTASDGLFLSEY